MCPAVCVTAMKETAVSSSSALQEAKEFNIRSPSEAHLLESIRPGDGHGVVPNRPYGHRLDVIADVIVLQPLLPRPLVLHARGSQTIINIIMKDHDG